MTVVNSKDETLFQFVEGETVLVPIASLLQLIDIDLDTEAAESRIAN